MGRRLRITKHRIKVATRRMSDCEGGMPGGATDTPRTHKGPAPSIVEALGFTSDDARSDRAELERLLRVIVERRAAGLRWRHEAEQLERILDRWDLPPERVDALRLEASGGDPGCQSCKRVGTWREVHARGMCKFCDRLLARVQGGWLWEQAFPPEGLVLRHSLGKRVGQDDIERHMANTPKT